MTKTTEILSSQVSHGEYHHVIGSAPCIPTRKGAGCSETFDGICVYSTANTRVFHLVSPGIHMYSVESFGNIRLTCGLEYMVEYMALTRSGRSASVNDPYGKCRFYISPLSLSHRAFMDLHGFLLNRRRTDSVPNDTSLSFSHRCGLHDFLGVPRNGKLDFVSVLRFKLCAHVTCIEIFVN